jgi:hypothetical protein
MLLAGDTVKTVAAPDLAVKMCRTDLGPWAKVLRSRVCLQSSALDSTLSLADGLQGGIAASSATRAEAVRLKMAQADRCLQLARAWIDPGSEGGALGSLRTAVRLEPDEASALALRRRLE